MPAPDGSWSARLADRLAAFGHGHRLARARQNLTVRGPLIGPGSVRAQVRGGGGHWHDVWIGLPAFSPQQWRRAEEALAADPACAAALAEGRLPTDPAVLDAAFARTGLSLLPAAARDLTLECSCPDRAVPCAHLAAVLLSLAEEFDADPFTLLALRGRDRDRLLARFPTTAQPSSSSSPPPPLPGGAELPLTACLDTFWELPTPPPRDRPPQPSDNAIHRLAPPGITIRGRNLADLLGPAYDALNSW